MGIFAGHTAITVSNLEKSLEFYIGLLGLKLSNDFGGGFIDASLTTGISGSEQKFVLLATDDGLESIELFEFRGCEQKKPSEFANHVDFFSSHVAFMTDDIERTYNRLVAAEVKIDVPLMEVQGWKFAYVYDPDGYLVELVAK